ncbi:MAG: hypothetical protein FWG60_00980 [Methanomassiliicoccaceae archaeon]|nr:hypothetical protein [Methanomassiliicoccaceae archaeon]
MTDDKIIADGKLKIAAERIIKTVPAEQDTTLKTEFEFTLPVGYADENGALHKTGMMRLATAADEILPMRDPRVQQNPSYMIVILLSRVIIKLGDVPQIDTGVIERLFASDLSFLQSFYALINGDGTNKKNVVCPQCRHAFQVDFSNVNES